MCLLTGLAWRAPERSLNCFVLGWTPSSKTDTDAATHAFASVNYVSDSKKSRGPSHAFDLTTSLSPSVHRVPAHSDAGNATRPPIFAHAFAFTIDEDESSSTGAR